MRELAEQEAVPAKPTVFVVDDDADFRQTLAWLIESAGLSVETLPSGEAFLDAYDPSRPGCLVLDVRMRGMSGLELLERLGGASAPLPVIMMTGYGDFHVAVRALKGGALDIFRKPFDDFEVVERIRQAIASDHEIRAARGHRAMVEERLHLLSPRERAVLELLVAGRSSKEIAQELDTSVRTAESHRASVMRKMGVDSTPKLVRMVLLARAATDRGALRETTEPHL